MEHACISGWPNSSVYRKFAVKGTSCKLQLLWFSISHYFSNYTLVEVYGTFMK
jgi:hypothetical protein